MWKWLPLLGLLLLTGTHAEIYKWVDPQGNVHYGDAPEGPGARQLKNLPGLSTYAPRKLPEIQTTPANGQQEEHAAQAGYKLIELISPEPEATVRSAPGEVPVFVALDPALRDGDYLKVVLDGKALPEKYTTTAIKLENVDRGEHKVAVAVYDRSGRKLKQSAAHTFYLHRTIARPAKAPRGS